MSGKPKMSTNDKLALVLVVLVVVLVVAMISFTLVVMFRETINPIPTPISNQVGLVQTHPGGVWWQVGVFRAEGDRAWVTKDKPTIVDHTVTPTSSSARPTNFIRFVPLGTDHYMYLRADYFYPIQVDGEAVPNRKFPNGESGAVE